MNADGTNKTNLTNDTADDDTFPAWSPDSGHIAFTRFACGRRSPTAPRSTR